MAKKKKPEVESEESQQSVGFSEPQKEVQDLALQKRDIEKHPKFDKFKNKEVKHD